MMNFFCKVKQMPSLGIFYTPPNSCEATVVTVSDEDMAAAASCDVLNALGLLSCMLLIVDCSYYLSSVCGSS